jgi:hypothetical protein
VAHLRRFVLFGFTFPVLEAQEVVGGGYRQNAICPRCGALDRERLVYLFVLHKTDLLEKPTKLLHVAPERALSAFLRSLPTVDYTTADLRSPYVMVNTDITRMLRYCGHSDREGALGWFRARRPDRDLPCSTVEAVAVASERSDAWGTRRPPPLTSC